MFDCFETGFDTAVPDIAAKLDAKSADEIGGMMKFRRDAAEFFCEVGLDLTGFDFCKWGGALNFGVIFGYLQAHQASQKLQHLNVVSWFFSGDFVKDGSQTVLVEATINMGHVEKVFGLAACFPAQFHVRILGGELIGRLAGEAFLVGWSEDLADNFRCGIHD